MTKKKYPEEIYPETATQTGTGPIYWISHRKDYERAYDLGFRDGSDKERLAGWSNLTEAIKTGECIDWDALDGIEAKCVHPELGTLTRNLARRKAFSEETANGWCQFGENTVWEVALPSGWYGLHGWSVWVKGDLPLRKLTADQLALGTCFRARYQKGALTHTYAWAQVVEVLDIAHVACFNEHFTHVIASYHPADIDVLEVYGVGIFQAPKEEV